MEEIWITLKTVIDKGISQFVPIKKIGSKRSLPWITQRRVYSTCVKNVMLHAVETWAMTAATQNSLWHNELAHIHWFCNVKVRDEFILDSLLSKPGIQDLDVEPRTSRIRWLGYVERSTGWIAKVSKLNVVAQKRRSRPTKICDEVLVDDRMKLGMDCATSNVYGLWYQVLVFKDKLLLIYEYICRYTPGLPSFFTIT